MGISEILTKKTGGTPDVTMAKVSETLKASLDQLLQTKQMESVAEVVKTIVTKDNSTPNPFAGLKEIGVDIKSIMEGDRAMAQTALAELHKTREQVLEEKKKNLELIKSEKAEELSAQKSMLEIITNIQNKSFEQQLAIMRELYQERIKMLEENKKPQEKDAVKSFMEEYMIKLLMERLESRPPDPKDQLLQYYNVVKQMGEIFGANRSNIDGLEKLKYELELRKLELESERIKTEYEEKRKIEEKKAENVNSFLKQLGEILPAAVALIKGGGNVPVAGVPSANVPMPTASQTASQAVQPQSFSIICPYCGEEMVTSNPQSVSKCDHCGKPIAIRGGPVGPVGPANRPASSSEEVLDI